MRFYLATAQYNKEAKAENRMPLVAKDSYEEIEKAFYKQVDAVLHNAVLGGSVNIRI